MAEAMFLSINPENPQLRLLQGSHDVLDRGGVIIFPTGTGYSLGCDITQKKAVERLCRIRDVDPERHNLVCMCHDLKVLSLYAAQIDTALYKIIRCGVPGPFAFILKAGKQVPRFSQTRKKTIGLRIPDHPIALELIRMFGRPLISASLDRDFDQPQYCCDPSFIRERYEQQVDLIIDGGYQDLPMSTVIDCSDGISGIRVLHHGSGDLGVLGIEMED